MPAVGGERGVPVRGGVVGDLAHRAGAGGDHPEVEVAVARRGEGDPVAVGIVGRLPVGAVSLGQPALRAGRRVERDLAQVLARRARVENQPPGPRRSSTRPSPRRPLQRPGAAGAQVLADDARRGAGDVAGDRLRLRVDQLLGPDPDDGGEAADRPGGLPEAGEAAAVGAHQVDRLRAGAGRKAAGQGQVGPSSGENRGLATGSCARRVSSRAPLPSALAR